MRYDQVIFRNRVQNNFNLSMYFTSYLHNNKTELYLIGDQRVHTKEKVETDLMIKI